MVVGLGSVSAMAAVPSVAAEKNWTLPTHKIYAQQLADETMRANPELLSVTLHGVPPGMHDAYTMFAGSYLDRIGNADDPDDIDISKKGITIVDPRGVGSRIRLLNSSCSCPCGIGRTKMSGSSFMHSKSPSNPMLENGNFTRGARSPRWARETHSKLRRMFVQAR